jgi:hypothetical protein
MAISDPYDVVTASFTGEDGAVRALAVLEPAEQTDLLPVDIPDDQGSLPGTHPRRPRRE